ncbi:23S rRNA (adenine(2030)-N(6))-methyltransferase RlmJ [Testudinibacter sp. TR-2022]|uniref:23S rRNA (adenine(2030)-N(6))-methyltransferase RlmJ n=1 Tax=Testudinibacter sp. TR-2022 TaxID=2585029 RepID=UPI00111B8194|nr:23S rRNA (adenine(2030)-N(6))-methyltransferase RlmJ [Testudinibacter sp. TR-2022]TNH05139.1 23S rRNA (adenine(2030)-N(6))-methyltransferase RlmJ [Pasteurellaceae bacterium Phil31]TNH09683.1 23S rRNA (adenine(2030)-N(6))-methyltransferase RlmJ [Testudinibacter sp. TR-2022]TNH11169.1 23S rRNA (adenine(2030)-N(6))-methyltransferase RlmJ [Testudinibacter sp. TR-2022]TNH14935.1 23S rRNA (adenine(2030)-N(6))-methyltransferase RlmJ [Testudinibacter sp. TR-2022]TNH20384.1 23S rRNA (adenine(2030)-N
MLSYRHSFHAGNHADVLKHIVLLRIIRALQQKEKGFFYLDTHAGVGRYSLNTYEAEKTAEYQDGVARLWQRDDLPPEVADYLAQVKKLNYGVLLKHYPGSPLIAANLLRAQDRALFTELHPSDFPLLRNNFKTVENVTCKRDNGYQQLKAVLPPKERRGLVLIDPPYELKEDYDLVVQAIEEGYKRFATGTYAIWYPVVLRQHVKRIVRGLEQSGIRKILQIELALRPDSDQRGMTASGMIVINPPWTLEGEMKAILPYLSKTLVPENTGSWKVEWITPE